MKRSELCRIASYKELCIAKSENYRALRGVKNDIALHADELAESLSPKALLGKLLGSISPLEALCRIFSKGG